MATETVRIENTTMAADWFQLSDGSHDFVHIHTPPRMIRIQDSKPQANDQQGLGFGNLSLLKIENANTPIWMHLLPNGVVSVMRGTANITLEDNA